MKKSIILSGLFLLFLGSLIFYKLDTKDKIENHFFLSDKIVHIYTLNNNLNTFLNRISEYNNFDTIQKDIQNIKEDMKKITSNQSILHFKNKKCVIFCGIAKPEYFKELLMQCGAIIEEEYFFPDHYYLKDKDYNYLNKCKDLPLITTEKDAVKINLEKINNPIFTTEIHYSFKKFQTNL